MFEAVILAGAGTRLKEITGNIPKPMVEINGIPFLYRLLGLLENYGCSRVVFWRSGMKLNILLSDY